MRMVLMSAALFAAACGQTTSVTPAPTPVAEAPAVPQPQTAAEATAADTCGASRFQNLIGTLASGIDQATLPAGTRVITPDMMVTQDFRADRLNIAVGTDGRVGSLSCY